MKTPICDFVTEYMQKDTARFHMPGHKGVSFLGCEKQDITEIGGADALYDAEGIIAESEEIATRLFGFGRTLYGTEGSSQCIRAMLFLALQESGRQEGRPVVLAARNAHKAFLYSCALLDLDVAWLMPMEQASLCTCPVTPPQLGKKLAELPQKPIAVYLTAPDYLGYLPDIQGLAAVCQKAGVPLLVDNAHGAYLKFLTPSRHPVDLGAAMSCDSAHKTLPVLTGGAYLQLSEKWAEKIGKNGKKAMELFGSTSPSYLILQSLDRCNAYLAAGYPEKLAQTIGRLDRLKEALQKQGWQIMASDPLKLTVLTAKRGYCGQEVSEALRQRGVECEFAEPEAVVLMATPENRAEDFLRIAQAFADLPRKKALPPQAYPPLTLPNRRLSIREAVFSPWEEVPLEQAVGRICAVPCVSCPPAIPIAVSGEEITAGMAAVFHAYGIDKIAVVCGK